MRAHVNYRDLLPEALRGPFDRWMEHARVAARDHARTRATAWAELRLVAIRDLVGEMGVVLGGQLCVERLPLAVPAQFDPSDAGYCLEVLSGEGLPSVHTGWDRRPDGWVRRETAEPRCLPLVLPGDPTAGPYRWYARTRDGSLRACRTLLTACCWASGDPAVGEAGLLALATA